MCLAGFSGAILLIYLFVGELAMVPTASMERTLLVGDHYFLVKFPYAPVVPYTHLHLPRWRKVARGEIVAFRSPMDPQQIFLKRVVASGGDEIAIHAGVLYVNGRPVEEPYALTSGREEMDEVAVPAGRLFMLGDNREHSEDSRFWGTVPEENVIGKPLMIFWSYDAPSFAWLNHDPAHQLRFYASVAAHFFGNTRWARLGARP